jgi:DNA-binding response OmpR family regulator
MLYWFDGMAGVIVVGMDWKLRAGVRAELLGRGIEALGMENLVDALREVERGGIPSAIVVDAECLAGATGLDALARRVPVLVVASRAVQTPRTPLAATVIYRPVSIGEIVSRVLELLQGQAA